MNKMISNQNYNLQNMNIFKLSWYDYDEGVSYLFSHDNKNQEEFNNDVNHLLIKYGNEYIEQEIGWIGANSWIQFIVPKLIEIGYKQINPIEWSFFGSSIIGLDNEISDDDIKWGKIVGDELFNKSIQYNSKKDFIN